MALGTTGVWTALAFFVYQDRKRKESDNIIKKELKKIRKAQKKCECRCQADCCRDSNAQEGQRSSWLFGLFCGGARR